MKIRSIPVYLAAALVVVAAASVPPIALAQQNTQQNPLVAQFQKIEDQWSAALVKQDQFTLEDILAPSFIDVSAAGDITSRNEQVAGMFEKDVPRAQIMQQRAADVRVIEDVAIVDGTYIETTKLNGIEREERGVFTHIYQRTRDTWKCVQSQRTAVPQPENGGKKPRKKKLL